MLAIQQVILTPTLVTPATTGGTNVPDPTRRQPEESTLKEEAILLQTPRTLEGLPAILEELTLEPQLLLKPLPMQHLFLLL
jgi:hypothetical protein